MLVTKNRPASAGDKGLTLGLGRSPGGGNSDLIQYSFLENSMDRGSWQAIVHRAAKSKTRLSDWVYTHNLKIFKLYSVLWPQWNETKTHNDRKKFENWKVKKLSEVINESKKKSQGKFEINENKTTHTKTHEMPLKQQSEGNLEL